MLRPSLFSRPSFLFNSCRNKATFVPDIKCYEHFNLVDLIRAYAVVRLSSYGWFSSNSEKVLFLEIKLTQLSKVVLKRTANQKTAEVSRVDKYDRFAKNGSEVETKKESTDHLVAECQERFIKSNCNRLLKYYWNNFAKRLLSTTQADSFRSSTKLF